VTVVTARPVILEPPVRATTADTSIEVHVDPPIPVPAGTQTDAPETVVVASRRDSQQIHSVARCRLIFIEPRIRCLARGCSRSRARGLDSIIVENAVLSQFANFEAYLGVVRGLVCDLVPERPTDQPTLGLATSQHRGPSGLAINWPG
jgi:hypothetical protein